MGIERSLFLLNLQRENTGKRRNKRKTHSREDGRDQKTNHYNYRSERL